VENKQQPSQHQIWQKIISNLSENITSDVHVNLSEVAPLVSMIPILVQCRGSRSRTASLFRHKV